MAADTGVTITQLVEAARASGYQITERTIRSWSARGLLDYPQRRALGQGNGSANGIYSYNQQQLMLTLLHHRPRNDVASLARIPVGLWMYFGDEYVNLEHARRAFATWIGDARSSLKVARKNARLVLNQLDNPAATPEARQNLRDVLAHIAYTGRHDTTQLNTAVRAVFEPHTNKVVRAIGHPAAPLTAEAVVELIEARLLAAALVTTDGFTDDEFNQARDKQLTTIAQYAAQHDELVRADASLYEQPSWETLINECCGNLLTILGLQRRYASAVPDA